MIYLTMGRTALKSKLNKLENEKEVIDHPTFF